MRNGVVAVVLVILVAGSLGVGYFAGSSNHQTVTTTSTATSTTTTTLTVTPFQTTALSRNNGEWAFSIRLSATTVARGEMIALSYNLTNISGQPQKVVVGQPFVNPIVYSANGSEAWAWNPSTISYVTTIPYRAGNWTGPFLIPTSELSVGQTYLLSVSPRIGAATTNGDDLIGESLMVNETITIGPAR